MKKIFLLIFTFSLSVGAFAQSNGDKSIVFNTKDVHVPVRDYQLISTSKHIVVAPLHPINNAGARTTAAGGRWYSYYDLIDANLGWAFTNTSVTPNRSIAPLWWDSSVTYRYSNGVFANEWAAVGQIIDPIRYSEYIDTERTDYTTADTFAKGSDFTITNSDSYTVDSIKIEAAYVLERHGIVDTLILTVAPQQHDFYYEKANGDNSTWFYHNPNIPNPDTIRYYSPQPLYADSIKRGVWPDNSVAGAVQTVDTFIINADSIGFSLDTTTTPGSKFYKLATYSFPVKHNTIPAGQHFAISLAFKSGDPSHHVTDVTDSINKFNRFCALYGFEGTSPTWMTYWQAAVPSYYDFNGSCYLDGRGRPSGNTTTYPLVNHTNSPARWLSQFTIQNYNSTDGTGSPSQYLKMDAHVTCASCGKTVRQALDVKSVTPRETKVFTYPNPATENVTISYSLGTTGNVTVSLTNAIGQTVATQNMGNAKDGKALFNVSSLPNGIYIYTIAVGNTRYSDRITVAH